jgi:hypothetical protein
MTGRPANMPARAASGLLKIAHFEIFPTYFMGEDFTLA